MKHITPKPNKYPLHWEPKPYIADANLDKHPCPEDPNTRILLIIQISKTQFERHATYEANGAYCTLHDNILWYTTEDIRLALDPKDIARGDYNIYAIAIVLEAPVLFGKLQQDTTIYNKCMEAFKTIFNPISNPLIK